MYRDWPLHVDNILKGRWQGERSETMYHCSVKDDFGDEDEAESVGWAKHQMEVEVEGCEIQERGETVAGW